MRLAPLLALAALTAGAGRADAAEDAVLLLVVSTPEGTIATFGQSGGDGGSAGVALARDLEALGFRLKSASGHEVAGGDGLVPDAAAVDLARKLGVAAVWVVGIEVKSDGPIRGTKLVGAAGHGQLRLLDVQSGKTIASADREGAGFEGTLDRAAASAAREIAERLVGAVETDAAKRWAPRAGPEMAVEIRGARHWSSVAAIIQRLGTTEGISAVHAHEVRRGRVGLALETRLGAARVAAAIERARPPSGTVRAVPRGDAQIQVEIRGDSAAPEPNAQD